MYIQYTFKDIALFKRQHRNPQMAGKTKHTLDFTSNQVVAPSTSPCIVFPGLRHIFKHQTAHVKVPAWTS